MTSPFASFVPPERHSEPGFLLRSYQAGDGAQLSEAACASYDHLKTFMVCAPPDQIAERSERLCLECRRNWLSNADFVIGIWERDESRVLGGCGYHPREGALENGNAEMGMWIRADAAGRGLGTAVLRALLFWGFTEWPWLRLSWRCSGANHASQRTAEKAGLHREGILRSHTVDPNGQRCDTFCYAMLRDEWLARRSGECQGRDTRP